MQKESDTAVSHNDAVFALKDELARERLVRQNVETQLDAATSKVKADATSMRELQMAVEALSGKEAAANHVLSETQRKYTALELRARDLEANLQHVSTTSPHKSRPRSSSVNDTRVSSLERELSDSKAALSKAQSDFAEVTMKLSHAEAGRIRAENELLAAEKRSKGEILRLQEALSEREEEINFLKLSQTEGLGEERERELVARIEEEEAKVDALQRIVQGSRSAEQALQKSEKRLKAEVALVKGLEEKNSVLFREKVQALKALGSSQSQADELRKLLGEKDSRIHDMERMET